MPIATLLFALATAAVPPPADHLLNPDFDTETSPWQFFLDGGNGSQLSWDSVRGDPAPGSAHVGNAWSGNRYDAWGQCVTLTPGHFEVRANVAAQLQAGNQCELRVEVVDQPNCNVSAGVLLDLKAHNTLADGSFETISVSGTAPAGAGAAAIFLAHVRSNLAPVGYSDCWFDHVGFAGDLVFAGHFEQ